MAETLNTVSPMVPSSLFLQLFYSSILFHDSHRFKVIFETLNKDFSEETRSHLPSDDRKSESANSNGFVALDVANLSLLVAAGEVDFTAGHRTPVKKTLSRKVSQGGGKRKEAESAAAVAAGAEKLAPLVHVAGDGEEGTLCLATTTAGVAVGAGHLRRLASRRPTRWLDPRRVLVFFATLSSVGTLILLYFTLFMGNIPVGDDNAW